MVPNFDPEVVPQLPAASEWSATWMFETVRFVAAEYHAKRITRAWAAQVLVDQMHRVSAELENGRVSAADCNRHMLTLWHHVELVRRHRGGIFPTPAPVVMRGLRLDGQMYVGLRLRDVTFHSCNLAGVDISRSEFRDCAFIACSFDGADLTRVRMRRTEVRGCSFRRAALIDSDFRNSRLLACNLDDATIDGAKGLP